MLEGRLAVDLLQVGRESNGFACSVLVFLFERGRYEQARRLFFCKQHDDPNIGMLVNPMLIVRKQNAFSRSIKKFDKCFSIPWAGENAMHFWGECSRSKLLIRDFFS